jgi:hypothetical protein
MAESMEEGIRDADGIIWREIKKGILASATELAEYEFMEKRLREPESELEPTSEG